MYKVALAMKLCRLALFIILRFIAQTVSFETALLHFEENRISKWNDITRTFDGKRDSIATAFASHQINHLFNTL